ncbi:MAG: hypothetical protein HYY21_05150, partial [Candidatus Tectomicrobia bacterium]|nr:hypothetical protein [Candidatus Tectomicrobia bacterium]
KGTLTLRKGLREARRAVAGDKQAASRRPLPGGRALSSLAEAPAGEPLGSAAGEASPAGDPSAAAASCLGEYLRVVPWKGGKGIACRSCGEVICPAGPDFADHLLRAELPLQAAGPKVDPHGRGEAFRLSVSFCPFCLVQVQAQVVLKEEGPVPDMQPKF